MPPARDHLTAGEWGLLALLNEQPAHGFALARTMSAEGDVGQVWAMRRPLVYRALATLERLGLVRPVATLPSNAGPQRTILEPTPTGRDALTEWLTRPIEHVRDTRSLLMLKLLFLNRRGDDPGQLLRAQRERFAVQAARLASAADAAEGFDRTLLLWRMQSTMAAVRFSDTMLNESASRT
ncbi:MAG: PadR family transcriptional regulator [Solirubrobacteraceae bacterium]